MADRWKAIVSPQDLPGGTYEHNLYVGGEPLEKLSNDNEFVDPLLSLPSTNRQVGNLRPRANSPAVGTATSDLVPAVDLDGTPRPTAARANRGAYQSTGTPSAVTPPAKK